MERYFARLLYLSQNPVVRNGSGLKTKTVLSKLLMSNINSLSCHYEHLVGEFMGYVNFIRESVDGIGGPYEELREANFDDFINQAPHI